MAGNKEAKMDLRLRPYRGTRPQLGKRVYVDPCATLVGDIELADDASIWPMVAARGDVNHIRIGARSNIQDGTVLHLTRKSAGNPDGYPLLIGEDVTVGHKAMLHGCTIGNRVLVGMGAILLDGVVVEDDVMIGAGSLVPPGKRLESGFLYIGNPVKQARPLKPAEIAFLKTSADNYVLLKDEYLQET
ncbi:gamma carbonic anhydrase family protein [Aeromonas veronii]|uniref:gamma carbonic anhydrase family protein n=1 Tax=Aeromonas veronii TaxID=654 RepID=UPI0030CBCBB1